MINVKNMGPIAFKRYILNKEVYIFGAGRALESCMDIYFDEHNVQGIVDNNSSLWGKVIEHRETSVGIMSVEEFVHRIVQKNSIKDTILMISSSFYGAEIVEMLDMIPELDGLECFLQCLIRNTKEETDSFVFSIGENIIPKKIHYIWVGGKPLPVEFQQNIETWRKFNPDYEIICWNESNYDFLKCDYIREAYESKQWGFVPNYARLDIIYHHGGIYLDTDVEVIQNFDKLLNDDVFMNMGCADRINQGCGFGAVAGHQMIGDMMKVFEQSHFVLPNGIPGKKACHTYIHPVIKKYGFELKNSYQKKNQIVIYPCEVMSPLTIDGMEDFCTEKTVSMHKEVGAWKNDEEKYAADKLKDLVRDRIVKK